MPRPHRPNPYTGPRVRMKTENGVTFRVPDAQRPWLSTHVKQETRAEGKQRKRREAEERQRRTKAA